MPISQDLAFESLFDLVQNLVHSVSKKIVIALIIGTAHAVPSRE